MQPAPRRFGNARNEDVDRALSAARPMQTFSRNYLPKAFLTSPTFLWTFPPTFSAVPRSRIPGSFMPSPSFSFSLPVASVVVPSILSFVLDFIYAHLLAHM